MKQLVALSLMLFVSGSFVAPSFAADEKTETKTETSKEAGTKTTKKTEKKEKAGKSEKKTTETKEEAK